MNASEAASRIEDVHTVEASREYTHRWVRNGIKITLRPNQPIVGSDVLRALHPVSYGIWEIHGINDKTGLKLYAYPEDV